MTRCPPASVEGAEDGRAQAAPDGSWLRIIDRPEVPQP